MNFYDTCALLNNYSTIFKQLPAERFAVSNISFQELEDIKTSKFKDEDLKFKARKVIQLLNFYFGSYVIVNYEKGWDQLIDSNPVLLDNNDSRIVISAFQYMDKEPGLTFVTDDLNCNNIARSLGIPTNVLSKEINTKYTGYKVINCLSDEEVAETYNQIYGFETFGLLPNQYLVIKQNDEIIDSYVYRDKKFNHINFITLKSKMFGEVKPIDKYQQLAIDSLEHNQITMIRGNAGTGKSWLSLSFLFSKLERGDLDKIIIFCNTVATDGSAKLGFYPGSRLEKLLDSQIGNFLVSKLGDRSQVERMINEGTLLLLPMSDIRGFDTTGMKAGVYITEAQNLNVNLMKLALQRIGEDCICILEGDSETQVDLPLYAGSNNGMRRVSEIFKGQDFYGEVTLPIIHRSKIAEIAERM